MHPLIRKLRIFAALSQDDEAVLVQMLGNTFDSGPHKLIAREDDSAASVFFLLEGFACRYKMLANGRRQILSFMIPGDSCDVGISTLERRDHSILSMTPSRWARAPDSGLEQMLRDFPRLRAALQWSSLVEEAIAREWIINLGQRPANARMAHVICEVYYRMQAVGLTEGSNFELPLTQTDLADTLGISAVHANRTLQDLRRQKLIAFGDRRMTILNLSRLESLAEFDSGYLHLAARYEERPHP